MNTIRSRSAQRAFRRGAVASICLAVTAGTAVSLPAHADETDSFVLQGRVVAAVTGTPVPGVCVNEESTRHWSLSEQAQTSRRTAKVVAAERGAAARRQHYGTSEDCLGGVFTDRAGRYRLQVSAYSYADVTATDYAGTFVRRVVRSAAGAPGDVVQVGDTAMVVGGRITGTAVDAAGKPVAGACPEAVQGRLLSSEADLSLAVVRCSGADGVWSLIGVPRGRYHVRLDTFGFAPLYAPASPTLNGSAAFRSVAAVTTSVGTVRLSVG